MAGNRVVVLRHGGPRALLGAGTISGDVYQALDLGAYPIWVPDVMRVVARS